MKKQSTQRKILISILTVTAVLLAAIYVGGCIFYSSHFFPNTVAGGIDCSNRTAEYLEEQNAAGAKSYELSIKDRKDKTFTIRGADIGFEYEKNAEETNLLKNQHALTWPLSVFRKHPLDLNRSFTFNEEALEEQIAALPLFDKSYITVPEDAYLEITEDGYEIVDEIDGNAPIEKAVIHEITSAVLDQKSSLQLPDSCYEKPAVCADDQSIADSAARIDSYTAATVHYEIDGVNEEVDKKKILSFLNIGEDGSVTLDDEKVTRYVQYLASTYNTYGDARHFETSKGDTVKIGGGDYGWVINKTGEKEQLLKDLQGKTAVSREPVYEQRAIQSGLDDIGDTYIEIDYTNQHLWYYKKGKLVTDTDIVSGNINRGNGSPDGVFKIVYLERNATLVGENYSSDVKYFMPFAYNVGIHDASWRHGKFGGNIYKTNGSHGCINVPEKIAKKLFETVKAGTPVIAYYRDPVKLTAENARISNAYSYVKE